ncbi:MAG: DegV family protein [Lachnospiraceae bacterium]|nr:DegV family protein [Lachnospiraceae bacterium]
MRYLVECYQDRFDPACGDITYVCHADCEDTASALKKMVLDVKPEVDIHTTMLSPIIGAHTGPGILSIFFYGKKRE